MSYTCICEQNISNTPSYNFHVNVAALCLTAFLTFIDTHSIYLSAEYIIQGLIIYQLENYVVIPGWTRSSALFLCRNGGLKVAVFWSTYSRRFASRDLFCQQHLNFRIIPLQRADPEILVRGWGVDFFSSKKWDLGATLRPPLGPGQRPGGGPGGEAHGSSWILVILGLKFNPYN